MNFLSKKLTQVQIIALGFALVILTGAFLLSLPMSSSTGESTPFLTSLFTATSATCVTGLILKDTCTYFSLTGQLIIMILIQIGGLGFMSIGVFFAIYLRRKIGLRVRGILQESVNSLKLGGIVRMVRKIVFGTIFFESVGAVLLSIRFIPEFGVKRGIYYGVFHSISAFCNGGFDLMGVREPYSSLTSYVGDPLVNGVIMSLIIIGGIGFFVWTDIAEHKMDMKHYTLHTKIVLLATVSLIAGGALIFFFLEKDFLLKGLSGKEVFLASLFHSVTMRTAGFNTTDTGNLRSVTQFFSSIWMFIGGSPGSTAGGIKTTTMMTLLLFARMNLKRTRDPSIFGRRLDDEDLRKASVVITTNMALVIVSTILISGIENLPVSDVLFETSSAMATVGMSTGITRSLGKFSQCILIFLMYCGRIGSLTFALSFRGHKITVDVKNPKEDIMIG